MLKAGETKVSPVFLPRSHARQRNVNHARRAVLPRSAWEQEMGETIICFPCFLLKEQKVCYTAP